MAPLQRSLGHYNPGRGMMDHVTNDLRSADVVSMVLFYVLSALLILILHLTQTQICII